ncbi:MAG: hypothetical protein Q7U51_00640, partial [Methanoregula sp.]|nr:hypothetical protein [Methanoregula sp.]
MTFTRLLSKIVHEWMGWCPYAHTIKVQNRSDAGLPFPAGNLPVNSPGPSGADGSRNPRELYERTQRGSLIIGAISAVIIIILTSMYLFGIVWVTVFVLGIMIVVLAIFSTLTVSVGNDNLRIRFGPVGLIRKSWPLADIDSVMAVTNPWYYGWGIRFTPHGRLYNVSGYGAVEVRLISGKTFRIGTGEPDALCTAIEKARTIA